MFDDEETKVEEILTMILSSNASTVRNLVNLERTRKDLSGHQRSVLKELVYEHRVAGVRD